MPYVRTREEKERGSSGVVGVTLKVQAADRRIYLSVLQQLADDLFRADPGNTVTCLPAYEMLDHVDSPVFVTLPKGMEYSACHHWLFCELWSDLTYSSRLGGRTILVCLLNHVTAFVDLTDL
jgi:hypothetical protein